MNVENLILSNLIHNEEYGRKVLPYIKDEYLQVIENKKIFEIICDYVNKYNAFPEKTAIQIELSNSENLNETQYKNCLSLLEQLSEDKNIKLEWLVDKTEKFCKERAMYNAIMKSINIIDDKTGKYSTNQIQQIVSDALAVSFDNHIGHDFIDDAAERFDFYQRKEEKIPFDLDYFNLITKNGLSKKTLNIILAPTGVGKTLFMCHIAASMLSIGKNVLYISMEMAEEKIAERIDANLFDIPIQELSFLSKELYERKINRIKSKTNGKLIIKEYPTASAGSNNFRHLINELSLKKNFTPDIIFIDYLNICMSSRVKQGSNVNSYSYVKSIAEELRGLAVEFGVPVVSATQTNRGGFNNSDIELTDTSESMGLPATADLMFALITSEELDQLNQIMVKQLKNRYNDPTFHKKFVIGVDRSKMKLYNVEQSAQDLSDSPVMDNTRFGEEVNERPFAKKPRKFNIGDFK